MNNCPVLKYVQMVQLNLDPASVPLFPVVFPIPHIHHLRYILLRLTWRRLSFALRFFGKRCSESININSAKSLVAVVEWNRPTDLRA